MNKLGAWEQIRVVPISNSDFSKTRNECTFLPISQQLLDGFSPNLEGRWVAMGSVYHNIYMNLTNLVELQESAHVVVTLKISFYVNNIVCPTLLGLYLNNHCIESHQTLGIHSHVTVVSTVIFS